MSHATARRFATALLAMTLVTAACGDDDDEPAAADDGATTTSAAAADGATTTSAAAGTDASTVEVTAADYEYEGLATTVPAGTTLTLTNASDEEIHELVAFRLPDDEARSADELIELPEGELEGLFRGPPTLVLVAPPSGAPQIPAVGDGSLAEPGRYLYFCAIPTGADPDAYLAAAAESQGGPVEVPGGPPHFVMGMYGEVEVQ